MLEFNKEKNQFERVHLETFGKSGCRRIVPGQFLAADPKGRAVMIGAAEKQKLVCARFAAAPPMPAAHPA